MESRSKYPCTQRELYAVCISGWHTCSRNIEKFTGFRPVYTLPYIEMKLKDIQMVSQMPNFAGRSARQELARVHLRNKLAECHESWNKLRLALPSIVPEGQLEMHYRSIGQGFYADSLRERLEACTALMDTASAYVIEHSAVLAASAELGADFPNLFLSYAADLRTCMHLYVDKIKDGASGSDKKLKESNRLYTELMMMFSDARIIFRYDHAMQKDFFFETQLDLISGQAGAGINGVISSAPIPFGLVSDIVLTLMENGDEAYVEPDGHYRFTQLGAGIYTMKVAATGFRVQIITNIVVSKDAFSVRNITLVPEPITEDK
jgi:hypothetical protein